MVIPFLERAGLAFSFVTSGSANEWKNIKDNIKQTITDHLFHKKSNRPQTLKW